MRALGMLAIVLVAVAGACGSSGGTNQPTSTNTTPSVTATAAPPDQGAQPPHVLAALPEGKLLVIGAFTGAAGYPTYVIEGNRAIALAPTEVTMSFDGKYASYLERPNDFNAQPTALVVRRTDGTAVFRLAWSSETSGGAGWAPSGNRFSFQVGGTAYIRNIDTGEQLQFEAPEGAHGILWLAGGAKLLLFERSGAGSETEMRLYIMDATSGATSELVLPAGAIIGPAAEFDTFSPDGKYIGYPSIGSDAAGCFWRCDLWLMEIATGRTCLVAKDAPSHQYPQGVGWSPDSRSATYYAKYEPGRWFEQHAVDVRTCADTLIEPPPPPPFPTVTKLPIPGLAVGINAKALRSPSGRYLLVFTSHSPVRALPPGVTTEKPLSMFTPSSGDAKMYVIDEQSGKITTLVDEQREFAPTAWLP